MKMMVQGLEQLQEVGAGLGMSQRRINAVAATGMTRTMGRAKVAVLAEMETVIDRMTEYTRRSLFVRGATATRLEAEVWFKDTTTGGGIPATWYLLPNVEGGGRHLKRFERTLQAGGFLPDGWFAVPGAGARIDGNGNMDRGQIMQVLSQLRVQLVGGFDRNMSTDARKQINAQRKAGGRFFVLPVGQGRAPGVYQREFGSATGARGKAINARGITPVIRFVRSAAYRARFDFHGVAQRAVDEALDREIGQALEESLARMLAPGVQQSFGGW